MAKSDATEMIPEERRKEAFRALVEAQDRKLSIPDSRAEVARLFDLTVDDVRAIENEGENKNWPPL